MGLSTRELQLIIRATNQASAVLNTVANDALKVGGAADAANLTAQQQSELTVKKVKAVGQAFIEVGGTMVAFGAAAIIGFNKAISAAEDFDKQTRYVWTQVTDGGKTTLKDIQSITLDVAKQIPVPLDQLNQGLYDIFSTIKTNIHDARAELELFAKAAFAGETDVSTAAKSAFAIMNNFDLSAKDLNHILDVQFKAVQLGQGEYKDLASVIGTLAQSGELAGQSFETIAGALAFLSRMAGGFTGASTELKNIFNIITKQPVADKFAAIGVQVADAHGNFRDLKDIVTDLDTALGKMNPQQKAAALQDILKASKSAGANQTAIRGLESMVTNIGSFKDLMGQVTKSQGSMMDAFNKMDGPAAKIQLLKNHIDELKISIGNQLLPTKEKLLAVIERLLDKWNALSPATKELIVRFAAITAVVLVVVGTILAAVGVFLLIASTIAGAFSISIGAAIALMVAFAVAVAALIVWFIKGLPGIDLLKDGFDKVSSAISNLIDMGKNLVSGFKMPSIGGLDLGNLKMPNLDLGQFASAALKPAKAFVDSFSKEFGHSLTDSASNLGAQVSQTAGEIVHNIGMKWQDLKPDLTAAVKATQGPVEDTFHQIGLTARNVWDTIKSDFTTTMNRLVDPAKNIGHDIANIYKNDVLAWTDIFTEFVVKVKKPFNDVVDFVKEVASDIARWWSENVDDMVKPVHDFIATIQPELTKFADAFSDAFVKVSNMAAAVFEGLRIIVQIAWDLIVPIVKVAIDIIMGVISAGVDFMKHMWEAFGDDLLRIIKTLWDAVWAIIKDGFVIGMNIIDFFLNVFTGNWSDAWDNIRSIVAATLDLVWHIIKDAFKIAGDIIKGAIDEIIGFFKWLYDVIVGHSIIPDLVNAIIDWFKKLPGEVLDFVKDFTAKVIQFFKDLPGNVLTALGSVGDILLSVGSNIMDGLLRGLKAGWEDVKGYLSDVTGWIPDWKGPASRDKRLLTPSGQMIMGGLITGFQSRRNDVRRALGDITNDIQMGGPTLNSGGGRFSGSTGTGSVTLSEGAFQLHVHGNVDSGTMPDVQKMFDDGLRKLTETLRRN